MVEAFVHFVVQLALLGLEVQPSKCVAWSPSRRGAFDVLPDGVGYASDGVRMLGMPLGSAEYEGGFFLPALEEDRRGLDRLQLVGDP